MPRKINFVVRIQHWMDSVPGQTFLNYAYSWGAAIVILGALFKLTHLPGGNIMLFIGMGTEVVVFTLSAFDRPFDKTEVGKELPHTYETDEEIAARLDEEEEQRQGLAPVAAPTPIVPIAGGGVPTSGIASAAVGDVPAGEAVGVPAGGAVGVPAGGAVGVPTGGTVGVPVGGVGGGTIIIGGGGSAPVAPDSDAPSAPSAQSDDPVEAARAAIAAATPDGSQPFENEAQRLAAIIRAANDELLRRAQAVLSPEMEEATQTYIAKLQTLAETFGKVDEQSARLAKDSVEMENLNRTLTGINRVYELHLKSISLQVGTIDQINNQTQTLARQIEELNGVYARMIQALTVNMRTAPGQEA
jgi:uncharacterized damage-inducible protein DinB